MCKQYRNKVVITQWLKYVLMAVLIGLEIDHIYIYIITAIYSTWTLRIHSDTSLIKYCSQCLLQVIVYVIK